MATMYLFFNQYSQKHGNNNYQDHCCSPWGHKESDMTQRLNETTQDKNKDHCKLNLLKSQLEPQLPG